MRPAILNYGLAGLITEIDIAVTNPHLTQDHLSERLANAGVLPMFGFPTRVRYLYHKRPAVGGHWPGSPDETSIFPQMMYVDYVRVYQHPQNK